MVNHRRNVNKLTYLHACILSHIHTYIQTDSQTYRQTDIHTYKQTDRHTYFPCCNHFSLKVLMLQHYLVSLRSCIHTYLGCGPPPLFFFFFFFSSKTPTPMISSCLPMALFFDEPYQTSITSLYMCVNLLYVCVYVCVYFCCCVCVCECV